MFIARYMTTPPFTIAPEMTIPAARELLQSRHFRHLPVVDGSGKLIGMITDRDLRSAYPSSVLSGEVIKSCLAELDKTPVSAIMTRSFFTVTPDSTLDDALILLDRERVGALPVLNEAGKVVGIFSIRDLIKAYRSLFGLGERGSAMIVVADDGNPKPLTRISRVLEEHQIRFTRLIRKEKENPQDNATIYLRVNTYNLSAVRTALHEAGFQVAIPTITPPTEQPA